MITASDKSQCKAGALRRVLIVCPHFPPTNAADHQRVRMALPYLKANGWHATVLAVHPDQVDFGTDPHLELTIPSDLEVRRVGAISKRWARMFGFGNLAYRAGKRICSEGSSLVRENKFDLVFISTTVFPLMTLGPKWKMRYGVPYVLDFQDPWVSDYYVRHPEKSPPGGRLKYNFSQWFARRNESKVLRDAAHVICVSNAYSESFLRRYSNLKPQDFTTMPFGAPELDFEVLDKLSGRQTVFDPGDGFEHWAYIGRGGQDMAFALRAFFLALQRHLDEKPVRREQLRIHFIGTDYAPRDRARKTIEPIARECGVESVVFEQTDRLPYFETLRCLRDAAALIIPGSDDPGYTASKLYPYILAKKPLLAVFHKESSVVEVLRRTKSGTVVTFGCGRSLQEVSDDVYQKWFVHQCTTPPLTDWNAFTPYTAKAMAQRLCEIFSRVTATGMT